MSKCLEYIRYSERRYSYPLRRSMHVYLQEPQRQETYLHTRAPSEDSDQPAHSRSLIRIFTGRILDSQGYKVFFSCRQRRLCSDCADAQAYLNLRWAHWSEVTFSSVAVYLSY